MSSSHMIVDGDDYDAQVIHCSGCGEDFLRRNATRTEWVKTDPEVGYHVHGTADEDLCPNKGCGVPVSQSRTTELKEI